MEFDNRYASNGKGNAGVALGIIGTVLGALNGGVNVLGNNGGNCNRAGWGECSENTPVTRYEMGLQQQLAEKEAVIALRDANTYNDQKNIEMYKYVDGRFREFEAAFAQQAVHNQKTADSFELVRKDIAMESERRCCGDDAIVNYVNGTFYPKSVADVTVEATTTAQTLYNPIPKCGTGCCNGNN